MPEPKKTDETPAETPATKSAAPTASAHYKVKSAGLTGAGGVAHYQDETLTAEQIGDQARVDKLLAKKAIEVV